MQTAVKRSTAAVFAAALAGSVFAGISPAAATTASSCVATELRLPAGTPTDVHSSLSASDPTAKYQTGFVQGDTGNIPVLWTDGEPQVLQPSSTTRTGLIDVNSHGTVLGETDALDGTSLPWLYSNGSFQKLEPPKGLENLTARAINERGDVVGYGSDKVAHKLIPVVWPGDGSTPRRLRADDSTYATDINDAGVVVGEATSEAGSAGILWTRWDQKGTLVSGKNGMQVSLTHISGDWLVGLQFPGDGSVIGGRWNLQDLKVATFPQVLDAVNGSGDVAFVDDGGKTVVERPDGTSYPIDAVGYNTVRRLFERGATYDGAGDRDYGFGRPVLWSGCAS